MLWRRLAATGRVVTKAITMHIMPCAVIILVVEPPLQPHTRAHVCATATTMHIVLVEALCLSACGASVVHAVHVYVWSMYDVRVALNAYACAHRFFFLCCSSSDARLCIRIESEIEFCLVSLLRQMCVCVWSAAMITTTTTTMTAMKSPQRKSYYSLTLLV